MTRSTRFLAAALGLCAALACGKAEPPPPSSAPAPKPEIYVFAGRCWSFHESEPVRYEAVAVSGGLIQAAGSEKDVLAAAGPEARVLRLAPGQALLPGLADAHGHLMSLGLMRHVLDLRECQSFDEVVTKVRDKAARIPEGEWVLGRGWDQNLWPEKKFPSHEKLSEAAPRHPVWLTRVDGHAGLANAKAMETADVGASAKAPPGGRIERDASGAPTGVFVDKAMELVGRAVPAVQGDMALSLLQAALAECASYGLTSVHDAGSTVSVVSMLQHLARQGTLPLRVYCMVDARKDMPEELRTEPPMPDFAGGMVAVRAVKFSLDGALGSRGAALLEPYSDAPSEKGLLLIEEKAFEEKIRFCHERGYQAAVHCIGDRANRTTLDVFERVLKDEKNPKALRWRIEHAQVTHPSDVPRFAALGLVASMQPTHCTSDMPWAGQRLGWSRLNRAYAWREFLKAGCVLAGGSDFPVESANPFYGIYAAVTRQDASGRPEGGWQPSQRLSRHEALRAFTWGAAYAAFAEERQGFLKPGAFADLVVVDRDPMEVPPLEIRGTKVLLTMTGGKISYRAPEFNLP